MNKSGQKNRAAVALGRKGGKATKAKQSPEERSARARHAVQVREAKRKGLPVIGWREVAEGGKLGRP